MSLTDIMVDRINHETEEAMRKKEYEQLASVVREIDNTLAIAVPMAPQMHSDIMEHVASRIALMLARESAAFDSFRFYEATGLARFRGAAPLISAEITATVKNRRRDNQARST